MPPPPPPAAGPSIIDTLISLVPVRVAGSATSADGPISFATPDGAPPAGFDASDLARTNELARLMLQNPTLSVPPLPSQPGPNMRSAKVARAKEDGNSHFRKGEFADAVRLYTLSADLAATRPVCEANVYARDELALALCNRSAAYASLGEHINALVDADAVLQLKRNWPKGHFRKGKALAGAGRLDEARESYLLGLQFDPSNEVRETLAVSSSVRVCR